MTITYEDLGQALVNCLQATEEARFAAGDLLIAAKGRVSLKALASSVGRSESYLSNLRTVAEAFPPETRAQDQSWSLHRLCARTSDPTAWLTLAIGNGWSVRQLRERLIEDGELEVKPGKEKVCQVCGAALVA